MKEFVDEIYLKNLIEEFCCGIGSLKLKKIITKNFDIKINKIDNFTEYFIKLLSNGNKIQIKRRDIERFLMPKITFGSLLMNFEFYTTSHTLYKRLLCIFKEIEEYTRQKYEIIFYD